MTTLKPYRNYHLTANNGILPTTRTPIYQIVLDDITRRDLFEYAKMLKKNHTPPESTADFKDIK